MKKAVFIISFILFAIVFLTYYVVFRQNLAPVDQKAATVSPTELRSAGLFDVTSFGADKTGVQDSTDEIQRAMNAAYDGKGITFFPPGTYRINNTLVGLRDRGRKDFPGYQLIGSTEGSQLPTIILTQGSFTDNNNANDSIMSDDGKKEAMIHLWGCTGTGEGEDGGGCTPAYNEQLADVNKTNGQNATGYNAYLRNLRFVIEPNNPDAIGVRITGNQGNHVSNLEIEANGGFIGYYGTVGTNSFVEDITVTGGKYGVYNGYGGWGSYSNVTLRNQELLAFTSPQGPPVSLSGFHIIKQSAPAIGEVPGVGYSSSNTDHTGAFSLNDGVIEFTSNNPNEATIKTPLDKQVSVVNVFVKNSGILVQAGTANYSGNANGWSKINVFSNTIPGNGYKLIEGVETKGEDYEVQNTFVISNVTPPNADKIKLSHSAPNIVKESPDKLMRLAKESGSGVVNVVNEGITPLNSVSETSPDYSVKINELINRQGVNTIFFPKGIYPIKATLNLKTNTRIIGINPNLTTITTHLMWKPGQITDMISTVNDANGETMVAFIGIEADRSEENNKFNNVHWRVGKKSVIYQVGRGGKFANTGCKAVPDVGWGANTYWLWFTDNGGGRVWNGNAASSNCARWDARNRAIFIDGTTQPIVIYSLNPEDGHGEYDDDREGYMVEIKNAKNVSIRSDKSENDNALLIKNSENIFIMNMGGSVETALRDNSKILLMNTVAKFHTFGNDEHRVPKDLVEEEINGNIIKKYNTTNTLSVVKRGEVDFSVWDYSSDIPIHTNTPTPTPSNGPSLTPSPTPSITPTLSFTQTPSPIATITGTINPTNTPTIIIGNICGKADIDGNGIFKIADFAEFAKAYGRGVNTCVDINVDYGPCGGRDVNRDGKLNIADFGGTGIGFAQRYYPKTSCAL
jgi:hypothetical protein